MLESLGYVLVARNFRTRHGEIDLVAVDGDCLVICEVRARVGPPASAIDSALDSIGPRKQLQLRRMAREWFRENLHLGTRRIRFDAVAVALSGDGRPLATRHIREAF